MTWLVVVLVFSVLVSLFRGGKLSNLTEIYAKGWWLLLIGFGMQIAANYVPDSNPDLAIGLVLASYLPLLIVVLLNRNEAGMWIAGIGVLMNFTVIALNQGMPVLPEAAELAGNTGELVLGAKHVVLDTTTRLPFLGDIIPLPGSVISLGDVFFAIGLGVFVEDQMQQPVKLFRHRVQGIPGRTHPLKGRQIIDNMLQNFGLEHIDHSDIMLNIATFHHEAVNGSGYPLGRSGNEIPLEARIVAVADIFDALTSNRPYKEAWSNEKAFEFLQKMAGETLDGDCVKALLDNKDEVLRIQKTFQEKAI